MDVMSKLSNYYNAYKPLLVDLFKKTFPSHKKALNNLDKKLQKYLNFKKGFFIEAGAYDGVNQSNTYFLEKAKKWNGILIEPMPVNFDKITLNRTVSAVNCALVDSNFIDSEIKINYAGLMSVTNGVMGKDQTKEHVANGIRLHNFKSSYQIRVEARTLSSIIDEFGSPSIDFLSLDVEGAENFVLNGIDFERHRPKYILVEERKHNETMSLIESFQYIFLDQLTNHDYLYKDTN
jgi:FkbM family methyltransferase